MRATARMGALAALMHACVAVSGPAGEGVLVRGGGAITDDRLRTAIEARVGDPSQGTASVVSVYRWHPVDGVEMVVWVTCRGSGNGRACAVTVGRALPNGTLHVVRSIETGWAPPGISAAQDRLQLLLEGDDGRGTWRQLMAFDPQNGGTVDANRRQYADGF